MCLKTHLGLFYTGKTMGWHMPNGSYGEARVSMGVGAFMCLFVLDYACLSLFELV
jgi:hypothetical protein